MSDPLRQALWERTLLPTPAGIQAGELLERCQSALPAELCLLAAARQALARHGPTSPAHCALQCELGELYVRMSDGPRALQALRLAAGVVGGEEVERDRLTARLLLARQLAASGEAAAAEEALRQDLAARRAFYGEEHPATALGLRELGEVLLRRGRADEALECCEEALELLVEGDEPGEVLPTLVLRLEAAAAAGEPPFEPEELAGLDPELANELALLVAERAAEAPPERAAALLRETGAALRDALGSEHPARVTLLAAWPDSVPAAERLAPLRELVALADRRGQRLGAISARTALARAQLAAGQEREAAATAAEAVTRARALRDRAARSRALALARRAEGELLGALGRPAASRAALEEAVAAAREADPELLGPALAALGQRLAAAGEADPARGALLDAVGLLPAAHPAAQAARETLEGLSGQAPADPAQRAVRARERSVRRLARAALDEAAQEGLLPAPPDDAALDAVQVRAADGDRWRIELAPAPEPGPAREALELAARHALLQLGLRL